MTGTAFLKTFFDKLSQLVAGQGSLSVDKANYAYRENQKYGFVLVD